MRLPHAFRCAAEDDAAYLYKHVCQVFSLLRPCSDRGYPCPCLMITSDLTSTSSPQLSYTRKEACYNHYLDASTHAAKSDRHLVGRQQDTAFASRSPMLPPHRIVRPNRSNQVWIVCWKGRVHGHIWQHAYLTLPRRFSRRRSIGRSFNGRELTLPPTTRQLPICSRLCTLFNVPIQSSRLHTTLRLLLNLSPVPFRHCLPTFQSPWPTQSLSERLPS